MSKYGTINYHITSNEVMWPKKNFKLHAGIKNCLKIVQKLPQKIMKSSLSIWRLLKVQTFLEAHII